MKKYLFLLLAICPFFSFSQTAHGCIACKWYMEQYYNENTKEFDTKVNDPIKHMMNVKNREITFIGNDGTKTYKLYHYQYDRNLKADVLHIKDNAYTQKIDGIIYIPRFLPGIVSFDLLYNNQYAKRLIYFDCTYAPSFMRNSKYCR